MVLLGGTQGGAAVQVVGKQVGHVSSGSDKNGFVVWTWALRLVFAHSLDATPQACDMAMAVTLHAMASAWPLH